MSRTEDKRQKTEDGGCRLRGAIQPWSFVLCLLSFVLPMTRHLSFRSFDQLLPFPRCGDSPFCQMTFRVFRGCFRNHKPSHFSSDKWYNIQRHMRLKDADPFSLGEVLRAYPAGAERCRKAAFAD